MVKYFFRQRAIIRSTTEDRYIRLLCQFSLTSHLLGIYKEQCDYAAMALLTVCFTQCIDHQKQQQQQQQIPKLGLVGYGLLAFAGYELLLLLKEIYS